MAAGWVRELDPITGRPLLRLDGTPVELYPVRPVESLLEEAPEALAPSQYCLREWEEYISPPRAGRDDCWRQEGSARRGYLPVPL